MSSRFSLQTPYVLASLPRALDHKAGRYVVGDVCGGAPGAKKRKRSELVVGIDGEGLNLYDVSSSRLITSYALPPQSSFACPPVSLRTRISKSTIERRTYAITTGIQPQISLFHDVTDGAAPTKSSAKVRSLKDATNSVVFIGLVSLGLSVATSTTSDLVIVRKDGSIQFLDGDTLDDKWISPASALQAQDTRTGANVEVEYVYMTNAHAASQSVLKARQDVLAVFEQEISEDGYNPDILVIVSRAPEHSTRSLQLITPPKKSAHTAGSQRSVQVLLEANFSDRYRANDKTTFSMQMSTGILQELTNGVLTTFDITDTGLKEQSSLNASGADSFLRLSNTSVMISSGQSISVYNSKYQSILATTGLDDISEKESLKRKRKVENEINGTSHVPCKLVTYFPKLAIAVAIWDCKLIAIQVEGHQDRQGRLRVAGLLIDSLGCSVKDQMRPGQGRRAISQVGAQTMDEYLPGSLIMAEGPWADLIQGTEEAFLAESADRFDELIAEKLHLSVNPATHPAKPSANVVKSHTTSVDRRWIIYTLSKIFSLEEDDSGQPRLSILFYPPNTFQWLIGHGHMTLANIEAAIKTESGIPLRESISEGDLIKAIVDLNPDMDILLALLRKNYLGAKELVHAIKMLMESLEMVGDNIRASQGLLTNGELVYNEPINDDVQKQLEKLEEEVENALDLAEYQLGPGSGVRGQALSLALSKLYTCPSNAIVNALQTVFTHQEIVCLIYLLRFELGRGAWNVRYLDADQEELEEEDSGIPSSAIVLISSLLNNCIDAVGAGGWLSGDIGLVKGDPFEAEELIRGLSVEVSAALEGIEEAAYLRGLTSEMIRFGHAVQRSLSQDHESEAPARKKQRPITLAATDKERRILPLGLKAEQQVSKLKVGAGGEVYRRTARDIGHLKSQKVGKYTLERIAI